MNAAENTDGDTVSVSAGTYDESVTIDTEGLTLEGAGADSTEIGGFQIQESGVTVRDVSAIDPSIRDFNGVEIGTGSVDLIEDVTIEDASLSAPIRTFSSDVDGLTIDGVSVELDSGSASILVLGKQNANNTNVEIRDSTFDAAGQTNFDGITVQANAGTEADVLIENNTFENIGFNGDIQIDLDSDATANVEIRENTFRNDELAIGISTVNVDAANPSGDNITIEDNSFENNDVDSDDRYIDDDTGDLNLDAILNDQGNTFDPDAEVDDENDEIVAS